MIIKKFLLGIGFISLALIILVGCQASMHKDGAPAKKINFSSIPNAKPTVLPRSPYGNPSSYSVNGHTYHVLNSAQGFDKKGIASWYGTKFHGKLTSTRKIYDMYQMTAAMRTVPIPSFALVTNLQNGRQVVVKVDDRGPFVDNRIIDLSYAAAGKLDMLKKGTALVDVKIINPVKWNHLKSKNSIPIPSEKSIKVAKGPQIYVQVAAYKNKSNAEHESKKLKDMILQRNRIEPIIEPNGTLYRVQIGPMASMAATHSVIHRLESLGFKKPLVLMQ